MLVELTGCSGCGKTELYKRVQKRLGDDGLATSPLSALLGRRVSRFVSSHSLQNLIIEALTYRDASSALANSAQLRFLLKQLTTRAAATPWERLRLLRSTRRAMGLHFHFNHPDRRDKIILIDEGTVHLSHVIFGRIPDFSKCEFNRFLDVLPLPDILVWVTAPLPVVCERLLKRGALPLPDRPNRERLSFLQNAQHIFDDAILVLKERVKIVRINNDTDCLDNLDFGASKACQYVTTSYDDGGIHRKAS